MAASYETFYTRHGLAEIADDRALHCINCDHECPILQDACCECGLKHHGNLDGSDTYPVRPRHYYSPRKVHIEYSFPKFVELPKEIRLLIWESALPGPRVVLFNPLLFERSNSYSFKTHASIPLVQVCRESYDVVSRVYKKYLLTDSLYSGTWFNFQLDTIYIDFTENINHRLPLTQAQEFAEQAEAFAGFWRPDVLSPRDPSQLVWLLDSELPKLILLFKNAKTVTLVSKRHDALNTTDLTLDWDRPDIDASLQFYREPFEEKTDQKYAQKASRYAAAVDSCMAVNTHQLKRRIVMLARKRNHFGIDISASYELPEIKHAIVTTSYLRNKLEDARRAYEEQKAMIRAIEVE